MKSNELIAAEAGDVLDVDLENIRMCVFCYGIACSVSSPF